MVPWMSDVKPKNESALIALGARAMPLPLASPASAPALRCLLGYIPSPEISG